jgi:hypothetical protein
MADIFLKEDVRKHFRGKKVIFLGDSIMRNIYQDFLFLLEKGDLTPHSLLRKKGTQIPSFEGDYLVKGTGELTPGRTYREIREYEGSGGAMQDFMFATYCFLTKCFSRELEEFILKFKERHGSPDLIPAHLCGRMGWFFGEGDGVHQEEHEVQRDGGEPDGGPDCSSFWL